VNTYLATFSWRIVLCKEQADVGAAPKCLRRHVGNVSDDVDGDVDEMMSCKHRYSDASGTVFGEQTLKG
jgi:hypothetical protein